MPSDEAYGPILSAADRAEEEARSQRSKDAEWLFKYVMFAQVSKHSDYILTAPNFEINSPDEVAVYMEAGAVPVLLNELVRIFAMDYSEQGILGGIVYITISMGCPLATYLFQNYSPK